MGLLAVACLLGWAGAAGAGQLDEAQKLLEQRAFRSALPLFEKAAKDAPGDKAAAIGLARTYAGLRRYGEAVAPLDAALKASPKDIDLLRERTGLVLDEAVRISHNPWVREVAKSYRDGAADMIDRYRAVDPDSTHGAILEARLLLLLHSIEEADAEEAVEVLEPLLEQHADDLQVHYWLGRAQFARAQREPDKKALWEEAAKHFSFVYRKDASHGLAVYYLARSKSWLQAPGNVQAEYYERAALALGDDAESERAMASTLGWLARWKQKPRKILGLANRFLDEQPTRRPFLVWKAVSLHRLGNDDRAHALFDEAEKLSPGDPLVRLALGEYLVISSGKPQPGSEEHPADAGVNVLTEALALCGDVLDRRVYDGLDYLAVRLGSLTGKQRNRLWMALWKAYPQEINAPGNAEVWWRDTGGDLNESLAWCERALKTDPDDPMILNDMGISLRSLERTAEAEAAYTRAVVAARKRGINHPEKSLGYKNAVRNLIELLIEDERFADLRKFADEHLKEDPRYETILELAKEGEGEGE
jgi:tetratricopeptide (TPR) repeat protein